MNDYMEYMNALSATTSVNEEAQNAYESMISYKDQAVEAKDNYKEQFGIIPELITGASGEFLVKDVAGKAISALTDTAKSGAKSLIKSGLKRAGVSEEDAEAMAESAVSGDIQGVASKGANLVTNAVSDIAEDAGNVLTDAVSGIRQIAGDAITQIQEGGGVLESLTGAVGRVGDVVSGVAEQGADLVSRAVSGAQNIVDASTGAIEEAQGLAGGLVAQAQGLAGGAVETATDTIANVGGGVFANLPDVDSVLSMLSNQVRTTVPESVGNIIGQKSTIITRENPITSSLDQAEPYPLEEWSDTTGALSRGNVLPSEFEMVNMADRTPSLPEGAPSGVSTEIPITEPLSTIPDVATAGAEAGAGIGADVGIEVGAEVGLEAAGAALDSTGILAPLGALIGVIGGLAGLFGLEKHSSLPPPPPPPPILNASTNFGT